MNQHFFPFLLYLSALIRVPSNPCLPHSKVFPVTFGHTGQQNVLPVPKRPPCLARFVPLSAASKSLNHALDGLCKRDLEADKVKQEVESLHGIKVLLNDFDFS